MPLPWVILKGLERTGVTLHAISDIWDGGDIILQESFPVSGGEHIEALLTRSQHVALRLLDRFLDDPESCWRRAVPQSLGDREYWPRLDPDCTIDWTWELETIGRYLRIFRPVHLDGSVEFISEVEIRREHHPHAPGTVLLMDGEWRQIAARDGIVSFRLRKRLNVLRKW